jgi:DNA-binding FadR family transcriptional regulator
MEEVFAHVAGPNTAMDREHSSFVDAIRSHNPQKAAQAMQEHLRSVRLSLFGFP